MSNEGKPTPGSSSAAGNATVILIAHNKGTPALFLALDKHCLMFSTRVLNLLWLINFPGSGAFKICSNVMLHM